MFLQIMKVNMTIEQILSLIGQAATWITVVLVFLTLREMGRQRKVSQKPELIVTDESICGYSITSDKIVVATYWSNKEIRDGKFEIGKHPIFTIYNIGAGAAKEIKIRWNFNLQGTIKTIQDYCYRNSIPIIVNSHDDFLQIGIDRNDSFLNSKAMSKAEYAYLIPASVTSHGLETDLPLNYLYLISILIFLRIHQAHQKDPDKAIMPEAEFPFDFPSLEFELSYVDIGGECYKKKFNVVFNLFLMQFPSNEFKFEPSEPAFQGLFEFKEKR
jgi:hypothetical protein